MNWKAIIITIVIVLLLYIVLSWIFKSGTKLTGLTNAKVATTIAATNLPNSQTNNYTYSSWVYIDDWSYRYGEPKIILGRLDKNLEPSPSIVLGALENNLKISVACYPSKTSKKAVTHTCDVNNIPLQKWVNIIISLYGRSLDVYIDGKLVRTCVLPGVAKVNNTVPVYITPEGGFAGFVSNVQYWADSTNPQQAWNIYRKGYGGSLLGELFNKYRIKVSFLQDNRESGAFEI